MGSFFKRLKNRARGWSISISVKIAFVIMANMVLLALMMSCFYYFTVKFEAGTLFNRLLQFILFSLGASLFVLVLIFLSLKKIIIDPILALNETVKSITDKNLMIKAKISSNDEIGNLSKNFNLLASSMQDYHEEILKQLYTDPLTNLPNRHKILVDIEDTHSPTLILTNIDFFKEINDFYGNRVGDQVLKELARRLKLFESRNGYRIYKMAADEFALLLDGEKSLRELEKVILELDEAISDNHFMLGENEIVVRVSFGAVRGKDLEKVESEEGKWKNLAIHADMALKKAKKMQKSYIIYDSTMKLQKEYENNIIWKQRLKEAIRDRKIIPFFQPIINNANGKVEKYESLVRIIDNRGNIITPHYFLDIAKKSHLYHEITKAVLERSVDVFRNTPYEFSINLTVQDIMNENMNAFIKKSIKGNQEIASRMVFEILESEGIENYKEVVIFIEEVKDMGCKIAIDDFGAGYSNFEHILRLSVNYIKIDASLVRNLDKDKNAQVIIKTIANFAKELGLKTITEYVHSKEIYEKSLELGIDFSQGYYFGEPRETILSSVSEMEIL
jgi:diguanylate cyclase (GGDEF)-like protein